MAGLSNFIANQATQETTMPSWYDQAQQNLVSGATTGASAVPALADTSAKYGIDLFKRRLKSFLTSARYTSKNKHRSG